MSIKDRRLTGLELMALGVVVLAGLLAVYSILANWRQRLAEEQRALLPHLERVNTAIETADALYALRARDVEKTKQAMTGLARKQKSYYEERLALVEERRLLEKQLELLETRFAAGEGKLKALRAERVSQEFPVGPLACYGEAVAAPAAVVTAKEFYAHPERGKVEMLEGTLRWTPPQVGTVSRQEGLGQYVIFTNTSWIAHLPPKDKAKHEGYAHCCIPLARKTAKQAYDASFIGSRWTVGPLEPAAPAAAPPAGSPRP